MSHEPKRHDQFGAEDFSVLMAIAAVLFFCVIAVVSRGSAYGTFASDVRRHEAFCSSVVENTLPNITYCEHFWFKAFADPTAVFTLGMLVLNAILAVSAIGALYVTLHGINRQQSNAERLFMLDQRPRLAVEVALRHPIFEFNGHHWTAVNFELSIENIGKTVAIDASDPIMQYHNLVLRELGINFQHDLHAGEIEKEKNYNQELIGVREKLRATVRNSPFLPSGVIQAGRAIKKKMAIQIPKAVIDRLASEPKTNLHFVFVVILYKGQFSNQEYESTLAFIFKYGALGLGPLPRSEEELKTWSEIEDMTAAMPSLFAGAYLEESSSLSIFT